MRYIIFILTAVTVFLACNTGSKGSSFNPENLETLQYVINIDRDTTIETKHGALLKIPKGALATDKGNTVTLEIKEAYTIEQMILGGLTTQSNGEPLSSGGMIYIGAAAGQNVTIKQKIQVAIPANPLVKDMKLYKGEEGNGAINWTNPVELPENKQLAVIDAGKTLFESKCASCHILGKQTTGPDLAHFMKRFPLEEANDEYYAAHLLADESYKEDDRQSISIDTSRIVYGRDTALTAMEEEHYEYYHGNKARLYRCNLIRKFMVRGTLFPSLTKEEALSLYRYIQNESDRLALLMPSHTYLKDCIDSCDQYKTQSTRLKNARIKAKRENGSRTKWIDTTPVVIDTTSFVDPGIVSQPSPPDFEKYVSPEHYGSVYYQFTVESFGWFNIDVLLKEKKGLEESELFVWIRGSYREKVSVYLIVPSEKAFVEGGKTEQPDQYSFYKMNGLIPLPQTQKCYVLAVTETESSIAYAIREFIATKKQSVELTLEAATKKEFNSTIQKIGFDNFSIKVEESKNAEEIRNLDQQIKAIEKLRPKGCDCDCLSSEVINNILARK